MQEVIIPPVPSDEKKKAEKDLERGFLKTDDELPAFHPHEIDPNRVKEFEVEQHIEETHTKEVKVDTSLPFEMAHKVVKAACILALVLWFLLIIVLSVLTKSDPFNILIGLSPVLLTIIVTYILVDKYHLESGFLLFFPIIFTILLFVLGEAGWLGGIKYKTLTAVNLFFGLLFIAAILVHYSFLRKHRPVVKEETEKKEEKKLIVLLDDDEGLRKFVSSIEDKSKALNAAIGRVYSVRKGGTDAMRKKIKIDAEHYNEFNELKKQKPDKRRVLAIELLRKIKDKLDNLGKPEKEVFDANELKKLHNLERSTFGTDKVIAVLEKNDKDPVKSYYEGAFEFCDDALDELVVHELEHAKRKADERKKRKVEHAKKVLIDAKKKDK